MRHFSALLLVTAIILSSLLTASAKAPEGFDSKKELEKALFSGQVKLIDFNLPVPKTIKVEKDIVYGQGGKYKLKLDLYSPKEIKETTPGLVFIHGGGWSKGKRTDYHYYGVKFAEQGYVVATVSYRLSGTAPFPAAVQDCKCAVRWMRANAKKLKVDPKRIGVVGGSAGGHLAMMVGYSPDVESLEGDGGNAEVSSKVKTVVNFYGPADLTTKNASTFPLVTNFLNKSIKNDPETFRLASPIKHVTKDDPPTMVIHGTLDFLVGVSQSDNLVKKLKETGVKTEYLRLDGWPHALDMSQPMNDYCRKNILEFLKTHLN